MTMSALPNQGQPQPPLLPPPARKIIPQPPPPPSSRPSLATDCSANALSHPRASVAKIVDPLQSRINKGSFPALHLPSGFTGRGLIPLPPPSLSFKPNGNAPPPPPPDDPAKSSYEPCQRLFSQPPLVLPLDAARSLTQQDPSISRSTVLVLPLPCCPHQSKPRIKCPRGRVRVPDSDAAGLQKSHFAECRLSHNPNPESGSDALLTEATRQESECGTTCQNFRCSVPELRNTRGKSGQETRSLDGQNFGHHAEVASGLTSSSANQSLNIATRNGTARNGSPPLHFHRSQVTYAPQPASPAWKGMRHRPCTHMVCEKPTKETSYTHAVLLSPSEVAPSKRTTGAIRVEAIQEQEQWRRACFRDTAACNGREVEAQPIGGQPTSPSVRCAPCMGKQSVLSSWRRDDESAPAHVPSSLSRSASTRWNTAEEEGQLALVRDSGHRDQRLYPQTVAHTGVPAERADTSARCSETFTVQWSAQCSNKPCHSVASSSSSGCSSPIHERHEYGASDTQGEFPVGQDTTEPQSDMEETPSNRRDDRRGRHTNFFLSDPSSSNERGKTHWRAKDCAEETLRLSRFDSSTTRRHSLRPTQTDCSSAEQQSTDAAHCLESVVDTATMKQGAVSRDFASSCNTVQTSSIQKGVPSFALTTRTSVGTAQLAVPPPPAEASEVDMSGDTDWASTPQLPLASGPPSRRARETEGVVKRSHYPGKIPHGPPWDVPCLQRKFAAPATPHELSSPERSLRPSPCTATLSHLPPSPLTPLVLTNNPAGNMLPSLLLAGEPQKNNDAPRKRESYSLSAWAHDTKTQNGQGQAEHEPLYCEQSLVSSPAPPSRAQSPRCGGQGAPRYRRRKQNKMRRRLKGKLRREEALGGRRQVYTYAVPPHTADEDETAVGSPQGTSARTSIDRNSSTLLTADEYSCKHYPRPSRSTAGCEFDRSTARDSSSMPDCEAWASSPAVVARHIKSRRLTRVDSEWCSGLFHKVYRQQGCCASQPVADTCARPDTGDLYASLGVRDQDHHMQVKCNRLFMPSNFSSLSSCACEGVTPQRGILYTFELPDWQRCEPGDHTGGPEKTSRLYIADGQQQKVQALQNKKSRPQARLHTAAVPSGKQISGQTVVPILPLPSSLGLPSRGCSTSTSPPSPLCRSPPTTHTAAHTSVPGDPAGMRPQYTGSQRQAADWCCSEGFNTCSPPSGGVLGAAENGFHVARKSCDLKNWRPHVGVQLHTDLYNGHIKAYRHDNLVRSRSASGCCSDSTYCDSTPSTKGASSNVLPEEVEALDSLAFRDKERSSNTDLSHVGDERGGPLKETLFPRDHRWPSAGDNRVYRDINGATYASDAAHDRVTRNIDLNRTANCHSVDPLSNNFSNTKNSNCDFVVVCHGDGARAHRGGGLH